MAQLNRAREARLLYLGEDFSVGHKWKEIPRGRKKERDSRALFLAGLQMAFGLAASCEALRAKGLSCYTCVWVRACVRAQRQSQVRARVCAPIWALLAAQVYLLVMMSAPRAISAQREGMHPYCPVCAGM